MSTVTSIDGTEIFYEVLGEGDIALVFVSGWGSVTSMKVWKYQLPLSSKYRMVLLDLAGHGKSGKNRETYTMELFGHDVKSVVEKLDLRNIILIGWSMGGAVILEAERLLSDRTTGLIAIDSLFSEFPQSIYVGNDEAVAKESVRPFEEDFIGAVTDLFMSFISDKFDPKDIEEAEGFPRSLDKRSMLSAWVELQRWDMHKVLPDIDKPVKCIVAGKTLPKELRDHYNRTFDAVYLEDLMHFLPWEDPDYFNEVLSERISEIVC